MRSCDILKICLHSARRHDTVERQAVPATPSYGTLSTRYFPSWQIEAIARGKFLRKSGHPLVIHTAAQTHTAMVMRPAKSVMEHLTIRLSGARSPRH